MHTALWKIFQRYFFQIWSAWWFLRENNFLACDTSSSCFIISHAEKWNGHNINFLVFFSSVLWLADLDISDNQKRQDILGGSIFKPETSWQALLPSPCTQRVAKRACSQASSEKIFQIFAMCLSSCLNATSWLWFRKTQQGLAFLQKIQVKVQE